MKSIKQRDREKNSKVKSEWIYNGKIVNLKLETYKIENKTKLAEVIHHPGAVVVLPIDAEGKLLLIQQWRRAAREILIELPAGTLEKNEEPLVCAKRELQEEIGFKAGNLQALGGFFTAPGYCNEYLYFYIATELTPSSLPPDDDEFIDLFPVTVNEAKQLIKENRIKDAKTVAGVLKYLIGDSHA